MAVTLKAQKWRDHAKSEGEPKPDPDILTPLPNATSDFILLLFAFIGTMSGRGDEQK